MSDNLSQSQQNLEICRATETSEAEATLSPRNKRCKPLDWSWSFFDREEKTSKQGSKVRYAKCHFCGESNAARPERMAHHLQK